MTQELRDQIQADFAAALAQLTRQQLSQLVMEPWLELRQELTTPLAA